MAMACTICNHDKRIEIDRMIVQGISLAKIAKKYDVPYQSLYNHSQNHLTRQLVTAMAKKELTESMDLLARIEDILSKAKNIFDRNYEKGKDSLALKALSEQRSTIELLAKIAAFLHESRAMELQANNRDEEKEQEYKKQLVCLSSDELVIFRSILAKMKSGDPDRRIRIPYTYIGRKERHQDRADYEKEEYVTPEDEIPEPDTAPDEGDIEEAPEPKKMTRTKKAHPLAIKPDISSPRTKLPRKIDNWVEYN